MEHDLAALQTKRPKIHAAELLSVYKSRGWTAYWRARSEAFVFYGEPGCGVYEQGKSDLRVGDLDKAIAAFNRLVDERCFDVVLLKSDPLLDPIRGDKRYKSLLERVNLAER